MEKGYEKGGRGQVLDQENVRTFTWKRFSGKNRASQRVQIEKKTKRGGKEWEGTPRRKKG